MKGFPVACQEVPFTVAFEQVVGMELSRYIFKWSVLVQLTVNNIERILDFTMLDANLK